GSPRVGRLTRILAPLAAMRATPHTRERQKTEPPMPTAQAPPNYLDPRVLAQVRGLEVQARLVVEGYLAGQHRSQQHGFAVEFAQHREYVPGDDVKHIDWKVWGRTERYYLKQYALETNLVA